MTISLSSKARLIPFLLALSLLAGACTSSPERAEPEQLVWAVAKEDREAAEFVVGRWTQQHAAGPTVVIKELLGTPDDRRQLLATELNAGIPDFDILSLDVIWTGEFAANGWLVELQDMRGQIEGLSLPGPFRSATWEGTLWAAPYMTNAAFLYYNVDFVDHAPRTWDEMVMLGKALPAASTRARTVAPFVGQGAQYEGLVVNYLEYFWAAGGDLFTEDGTEVLFQRDRALLALEFMRSGLTNHFYSEAFPTMHEKEALDAFKNGQAVFMRNWPDKVKELSAPDSLVKDSFRIAPLPTFDGEGAISALGGLNLAVSRFSEKEDGAKEFVKFASTDPTLQKDLAVNYARPPTIESVYNDLKGDPVMGPLGAILRQAKPRPSVPEWSEISDEIQQQIYPAYTDPDHHTAEQAVTAIHNFLQLTRAGR